MTIAVLVLFTVTMTGCAGWSKGDKMAAGFFLAAHAANAISSERLVGRGCDEQNPIMGDRPSDTELAAYFAGTAALALVVAHFFPKLRKPLLIGYGATNIVWTIHDELQDCDNGYVPVVSTTPSSPTKPKDTVKPEKPVKPVKPPKPPPCKKCK
jgi:hypothetical protein